MTSYVAFLPSLSRASSLFAAPAVAMKNVTTEGIAQGGSLIRAVGNQVHTVWAWSAGAYGATQSKVVSVATAISSNPWTLAAEARAQALATVDGLVTLIVSGVAVKEGVSLVQESVHRAKGLKEKFTELSRRELAQEAGKTAAIGAAGIGLIGAGLYNVVASSHPC